MGITDDKRAQEKNDQEKPPEIPGPISSPKYLSELIRNRKLEAYILFRIGRGNDFPVAPATFTILSDSAASSDTSVTDLANIILKDYGLTSKILKLVNSVHFMRFGEVTTVSRAILLLGIENIKNMVIAMSLLERLQKTRSPYLPNLLSKAIYAAVTAEKIAAKMGYPNQEEAFLCSLFYCLGEILTTYYVPERYAEVRRILEEETNTSPDGVIFAVNSLYRDVGRRIAEEWGLPGKVVLCMRKLDKAQVNSKTDLDWLHCICSIANTVAEITEKEPDNIKGKEQIEGMFQFFGERYKGLKANIDQIRIESMDSLDRYCSTYGIDFRETSIGEGFAEEDVQEAVTSKEEIIEELQADFLTSMTAKQGEAEETQNPDVIFANGMRDIARALLDNYEMEDIFTIIMETIYRGLRPAGITRTLLLIRNTKRPVLDVRLAMGDSTVALRKWFVVPVGEDEGDIFNISLQRQKDLLIKDSNSRNAEKLLPHWLAKTFGTPVFLMVLPIAIKGKSIGAIYIEGKKEALSNIEPTHFYYLKVLHDQAILAIRKKSGIA